MSSNRRARAHVCVCVRLRVCLLEKRARLGKRPREARPDAEIHGYTGAIDATVFFLLFLPRFLGVYNEARLSLNLVTLTQSTM